MHQVDEAWRLRLLLGVAVLLLGCRSGIALENARLESPIQASVRKILRLALTSEQERLLRYRFDAM